MRTITITKELTDSKSPYFLRYVRPGWKDAAGELYDLKNGEYLALVNSCSTGYSRRVIKSLRAAVAWMEKCIRAENAPDEVVFDIGL